MDEVGKLILSLPRPTQSYREYLFSLPYKERKKEFDILEKIGKVSPRDDGLFGEAFDRTALSFTRGMRGLGATLNERTGYSGLQDYFQGVLDRNRQWEPPEDVGVGGYIGGAIGNVLGSSATIAPGALIGGAIGGGPGAFVGGFAGAYSAFYGDNVQEMREKYGSRYSESDITAMASAKTLIDSVIEAALGAVPGAGKFASRLLGKGGSKTLAQGLTREMSKKYGKEATTTFFKELAKGGLKQGAEEGAEEMLQYINGYLFDKGAGYEDANFDTKEFLDSGLQGFIGGGFLGGVQGGIAQRVESRRNSQAEAPVKTQENESPVLPRRNQTADATQTLNTGQVAQGQGVDAAQTFNAEQMAQGEGQFSPERLQVESRLVEEVGQELGLKVRYFDEPGAISNMDEQGNQLNGIFDESTNEIWLSRAGEENSPLVNLGHEFKHFLDKRYPDLSKKFNELFNTGLTEEGRSEIESAERDFRLHGIQEGLGESEFNADTFARFWDDPLFWKEVSEQAEAREAGLGQKFLNALNEFIQIIQDKLLSFKTAEAERLFNNFEELRQSAVEAVAEVRKRNALQGGSNVAGQTHSQARDSRLSVQESGDYSDANTRNNIIKDWGERLQKHAGRFKNSTADADTLVQAGRLAIDKALRQYDESKGASLDTYLNKSVRNAMINEVNKAKLDAQRNTSLEAEGADETSLGDRLASNKSTPDLKMREREASSAISKWMRGLSERDAKMIKMRQDGKTYDAIGKEFGISKERAFQRIKELQDEIKSIVYKDNKKKSSNSSEKKPSKPVGNKSDKKYSIMRKRNQINPIVVDGQVRAEYQDLLENNKYKVEQVADWEKKALDWIAQIGGVKKAVEAILKGIGPSDKHIWTVAVRQLTNSSNFKNLDQDTRIKLNSAYMESGTEWGKTGVARRLAALSLDSYEKAQAFFDTLTKKMKDENLVKLRNKVKEITGVDILNLPEDILNDKKKLDQVIREAYAQSSSIGDKLYEYWVDAILSAVPTHAGNIIGNTGNFAYELGPKRFTEALINIVARRKDAANFGEFKEMWKAFDIKKAWKNAIQAFELETITASGEMIGTDGTIKMTEGVRTAISGTHGRIIRTPGRSLRAADEFAKAIVAPVEATAYAYREGIAKGLKGDALNAYIQEQLNNKNSAASRYGFDRALELAFQESPGRFVDFIVALKNGGGISGGLMKLLFPFIRTSSNLLRQGIRKSPYGAVNLAWQTGKGILGKRKFDNQYIQHTAEQIIAWSVVMLIASMNDDDDMPFITGASTRYGSAEQKFKENTVPPYSIRIGGKYYNYRRIEPISTGLALIADGLHGIQSAKNGKDATAAAKEAMSGAFKMITEKSYLDSMKQLVQIFEEPERDFANLVTNFGASWIPNAVKQARFAFDDNIRDYKSREVGAEWWKDQFWITTSRAGITKRSPKIDYFGREIKKGKVDEASPGDIAWRLVMPVNVMPADDLDDAERLIWNYNKANPNTEYWPDVPSYRFTRDKKPHFFRGNDYTDFAKESGELAHKQIMNAIRVKKMDVWNPKDEDIDLIKKIFSRARKETREKFIRQKRYSE